MDKIYSGDDEISKTATVAYNFLQDKLSNFNKISFLDIGCGNGRDIAFISSNLDKLVIYGIDISSEAIEKAIQRNLNKHNIKLECKDWKDLDDTLYDIIYISNVYQFFNINERKAFILKIKKILKPGGYFFLSTLSSNDKQYYGKGIAVKNDPNSFQSEWFIHFCSEDELRQDFKFLKIFELSEYFQKNYSEDTEVHTMWVLIGQRI